jgi:outer membrane usher protein
MRALYLRRLADFLALVWIALAGLPLVAAAGEAKPQPIELQLDVSFNGQPKGVIARFADLGDGRFASPAGELRELGVKVPAKVPDSHLVPLDGVPGVSYVYDEAKQSIAIEIPEKWLRPAVYDARGEKDHLEARPSDFGALLNYSVFGSYEDEAKVDGKAVQGFTGVNVALDARLLTPHGVLSQTGIIGTTLANESDYLGLETTYTFSDQDNLVTWKGGDFITGGVGWSRPIRMGGLQARRSFDMRPDLVTTPLPAVSGSAGVPSTVDVFVNGVKSYSQKVGAGPYQLDNIPSISGAGVAQVVTRDASGRETVQSLSFYTSPHLLRPGLLDFSVEAGAPRRDYGVKSFSYDEDLAGSATLRTGITDWLTFEAHGEAGEGVWNAGGGVVARALDLGIVSAAASASTSNKGEGTQLYGSFETKIGQATLNLRSQHAFGDYEDLASVTSRSSNILGVLATAAGALFTFEPPRAIDSATVNFPLSFDSSTVSATYLRYEQSEGDISEFISASYSRPLIYNASMFATGFTDIRGKDGTGLYVGINMPLDDGISISTGANVRAHEINGYAEVSKPLSSVPGSWGWRVRDHEGGEDANRSAAVSHQTSVARVEAGIAEAEGAVAMLGGGVYASNRVYDSFAVVDAHAPGVRVQRDNTLVGETNEDGKILVPNLSSFQANKISIDPMDIPLNAEIESTVEHVAPAAKSGVYVDFKVRKALASALVILKDGNGKFLTPGSEGRLDGADEPFIVGYDGQAFIKGLQAVNTVHIIADGRECTAQFAFAPTDVVQPVIGPEVCQ